MAKTTADQTATCETVRALLNEIVSIATRALNQIGSDPGTDSLDAIADAVREAQNAHRDLV